jgi:excisionase family DNA binding protein
MDEQQPRPANQTGTRPRQVTRYSQHHQPIAVTINEASRISGLGRSKIYQLIADGRLDSVVVDRRRLIRMYSLRLLLNA